MNNCLKISQSPHTYFLTEESNKVLSTILFCLKCQRKCGLWILEEDAAAIFDEILSKYEENDQWIIGSIARSFQFNNDKISKESVNLLDILRKTFPASIFRRNKAAETLKLAPTGTKFCNFWNKSLREKSIVKIKGGGYSVAR